MLPSLERLSLHSIDATKRKSPDDADDRDPKRQVYPVERLLDRYGADDGVWYYVKWMYSKTEEASWVKEDDVGKPLITAFKKKYRQLEGDDLEKILIERGGGYLVETKRGYEVFLLKDRMLAVTKAKAVVFDEEKNTRERRQGTTGGGGGRPTDPDDVQREGRENKENDPSSSDGGGSGPSDNVRRLLVWDSNTSNLRLSVTLALRVAKFTVDEHVLWNSLVEWTITRLWLLETVLPPKTVEENKELLMRIAETYYSIEKAAFDSEFKDVFHGGYKNHKKKEIDQILKGMKWRWEQLRKETDEERKVLRFQLHALRIIGKEKNYKSNFSQKETDRPKEVETLVQNHDKPGWWARYAVPGARSTKQNNLHRYRNNETKRFLYWMKEQWYPQSTVSRPVREQITDGLGSVFDGNIPGSALEPSVTNVDHTVAQSWFENTELLQEFCHVREDINNILPIPATQNRSKGARPVYFVSDLPSSPDKVDHGLFQPKEPKFFSPGRQAAVAARIFYTFLSNPLVTQQTDSQSALDQQGKGCSYYAIPHVHKHMIDLVQEQEPLQHDAYENLLILYVFRTYNPLLQTPKLLDTHEFAEDFKALLKVRLDGGMCDLLKPAPEKMYSYVRVHALGMFCLLLRFRTTRHQLPQALWSRAQVNGLRISGVTGTEDT